MARPIPSLTDGYDPSILHDPVDVDPDGPVARVLALLRRTLRLTLNDERVFSGCFTAYDKFGNFVLTNADEHFRGQVRHMKMVIIPLDHVVQIEAGGPAECET
jgi:small nuclear ribonucleoprotein (snRNP)-like protein